MNRRTFIERSLQTTATATAYSVAAEAGAAQGNVQGANERVNVALIGCGGRGMLVARLLRQVPNVEFVAVCDVYDTNAAAALKWAGGRAQSFRDFRRVLDLKDVHAVVVATPDHWHAIPTVLACQAGKDVYVEKPLAHNIREGRAMVEAARRHKRIVQTGTQHRSAPHYREVQKIIQSGVLGPIRFVRVWNYLNMSPNGLGRRADSDPPAGVDWDMYLGPAPLVPFNWNRFVRTYRSFWDYGGGFITDFGTHRLDSVHQVMGADAPLEVNAFGGRFELNDGAETPDTIIATYKYPNFMLSYEGCQLNGHGVGGRLPGRSYYNASANGQDRPHGEAFYGTNGTLFSDRIGFEIVPEGRDKPRLQPRQEAGADRTDLHCQNFIECVRSRQLPVADVEIGHKSSIVPHLGNIAVRTGRRLRWDAAKEQILGDEEASRLLGRQARKPWNIL